MTVHVVLVRALAALAPAGVLFAGSAVLFSRGRTVWSFLQLVGAGGFVLVALTHVSEALHVLPSMNWGSPDSIGHRVDLAGAVVALTAFPVGYLVHALRGGRSPARASRGTRR